MDDFQQRMKAALMAFDVKSAANRDKAESMVLVEVNDEGRWCVRLWHGVTKRDTGERAGVVEMGSFLCEEHARDAAKILIWWMRQALNLWGKPPHEQYGAQRVGV